MPETAFERRRFTSADVQRMLETGVLGDQEHLELINGDLVMSPPQGPTHASVVERLHDALREVYREGFRVRSGLPVVVADGSEPEPDLAVATGSVEPRHPRGDEAVLLIEVAQTSHKIDHDKTSVYAGAGVPVYWIVDVPGRTVEVYQDPVGNQYRIKQVFTVGARVTLPRTLVVWDVVKILP